MANLQLSAPAKSTALDFLRESGQEMAAPFSQPIKLAERIRIAGLSHHGDAEDLNMALAYGTKLELRRDPTNKLDPWTILMLDPDGRLVGYVPADVNEVLSRLMDAGKLLYATLSEKVETDTWLKLYAEVYLDD